MPAFVRAFFWIASALACVSPDGPHASSTGSQPQAGVAPILNLAFSRGDYNVSRFLSLLAIVFRAGTSRTPRYRARLEQ
jgi:hypothetical protein